MTQNGTSMDAAPENTQDTEMGAIAQLRGALQAQDSLEVLAVMGFLHPADGADCFEQLAPDERRALIKLAPSIASSLVLAELEDEVAKDILPLLPPQQISMAVAELDSDDATQLIEELDDERREEVLARVPKRDREDVEASLTFDEDTAGRWMQRETVAAPAFWSAGQAIDHMRVQSETLPDLFFDVYIIDEAFHPIGFMPLSALVRAERQQVLSDIMTVIPAVISPEMDQEDVAYLFEKYDLISAPVVDKTGRLSGMITIDDMVEVIQEENKEDMLALAGVTEAGLTDTALSTVRARAPWLLLNLFTAVCASIVISLFQEEISQFVALAVLMPIVASLGGNTGTQALTVAIRALATRDLTSANMWRVVRREGAAALLNGLIFAGLLALITWIWFHNWKLSCVIAAALVFNLFCAGLAGILVPLGLKRVGADPAVASSVFVTTVTDIVGFFAFLGLAATFLL